MDIATARSRPAPPVKSNLAKSSETRRSNGSGVKRKSDDGEDKGRRCTDSYKEKSHDRKRFRRAPSASSSSSHTQNGVRLGVKRTVAQDGHSDCYETAGRERKRVRFNDAANDTCSISRSSARALHPRSDRSRSPVKPHRLNIHPASREYSDRQQGCHEGKRSRTNFQRPSPSTRSSYTQSGVERKVAQDRHSKSDGYELSGRVEQSGRERKRVRTSDAGRDTGSSSHSSARALHPRPDRSRSPAEHHRPASRKYSDRQQGCHEGKRSRTTFPRPSPSCRSHYDQGGVKQKVAQDRQEDSTRDQAVRGRVPDLLTTPVILIPVHLFLPTT